jgi:hypothetical protein
LSAAATIATTDFVPHAAQVQQAAHWLATGCADRTKALVPQLRELFALSAKDAIEACRLAALIRARAH